MFFTTLRIDNDTKPDKFEALIQCEHINIKQNDDNSEIISVSMEAGGRLL